MVLNLKNATVFTMTTVLFIHQIYTMFQLVLFLSSQTHLQHPYTGSSYHISSSDGNPWFILVMDFLLLCLFMGQHSYMQKIEGIKILLDKFNLQFMERLLYNFATCLCLQIVMFFWRPTDLLVLWKVSTNENCYLWWLFIIVHAAAWFALHMGCIVLDMWEFMGIKQVYYLLQGWESPLKNKGKNLLRVYNHMRHPGLTTLFVICLVHPVMQADRLLLTYTFFIYMIAAFKIDEKDCWYHISELQKKKVELSICD